MSRLKRVSRGKRPAGQERQEAASLRSTPLRNLSRAGTGRPSSKRQAAQLSQATPSWTYCGAARNTCPIGASRILNVARGLTPLQEKSQDTRAKVATSMRIAITAFMIQGWSLQTKPCWRTGCTRLRGLSVTIRLKNILMLGINGSRTQNRSALSLELSRQHYMTWNRLMINEGDSPS